jgi:hypothetical protein
LISGTSALENPARDLVPAHRQRRRGVEALVVGCQFPAQSGIDIDHRHLGASHDRIGGVSDHTLNRSTLSENRARGG